MHYRAAAVVAFVVAVANNFLWNRRWTFARATGTRGSRRRGSSSSASPRSPSTSPVLEMLVSGLELPEVPAQALAIACATPLNFLGNKLWTFDR